MHDVFFFEINSIPSVFVASTEFVTGADAQSTALGMPTMKRVFVPHPIQEATDEEVWAKADACFDQVVAALVD